MNKSQKKDKSFIIIFLMLTALFHFYKADNLIENGGGRGLAVTHDYLDMTSIDHLFTQVVLLAAIGIYTTIILVVETFSKRHHDWLYVLESITIIGFSIFQVGLDLKITSFNLVSVLLGTYFLIYSSIRKSGQKG